MKEFGPVGGCMPEAFVCRSATDYADKSRKYIINLEMKSIEIQNCMYDSVTHDFDRVSDFNDNGLTPLEGQQDEQP